MNKKKKKQDPHADREAAKYDKPIPSREFILEYLKERAKPANYSELSEELNLQGEEELEALHRRIKAMIRDEQLERLKGGYLWPAKPRILLEGNVVVERGKLVKTWVAPKDGSSRVLLSVEDAHAVYAGNKVVVSAVDVLWDKPRVGRLVKIIEQGRVLLVGRFVQEAGFCHVIPHSKEMAHNILIPHGKENSAQDGHIVVVELIKQHAIRWTEPIGEVVEVLGSEHTPGIEVEAVARAYNLPTVWPEAVLKEISKVNETIPPAAKRGRLDMRDLPLMTIDGEDAKDFDDAVFCEHKKDGSFKLYVAIADVSYYVRQNTALDKEAQTRGNSVYFPGQVVPMLPEILSNGVCSLNPEVDRLCMVCVMTISEAGKITRYEFREGIMKSHARLTYTKAAALLVEGANDALKEQYSNILPGLQNLYKLYQILKKQREIRGAIEFETMETRIIFSENGKINRIEPVQRNEAHRLIEECMLCANVACARFLKKHKLSALYRNHEGPPAEKLADLKLFLNELGLSLDGIPQPSPIDYSKLLKAIQNRPDANIIQTILLRSLSQAVYSKDNLGHFGLAYPIYCHFTSPIRRYPDLWVHRQIRMLLRGQWSEKKLEEARSEEFQKNLELLGNHTSMTERRADDATRDVVRWLKCEYIQKYIGEDREGIISGVTRFGFFVELKDIYIDGLVHVTSLRDDYYYFDALHHRLVGERSGIQYKLGDKVTVRIAKVDIDERKIDFELINFAKIDKKTKKNLGNKKKLARQKRKSIDKKPRKRRA